MADTETTEEPVKALDLDDITNAMAQHAGRAIFYSPPTIRAGELSQQHLGQRLRVIADGNVTIGTLNAVEHSIDWKGHLTKVVLIAGDSRHRLTLLPGVPVEHAEEVAP